MEVAGGSVCHDRGGSRDPVRSVRCFNGGRGAGRATWTSSTPLPPRHFPVPGSWCRATDIGSWTATGSSGACGRSCGGGSYRGSEPGGWREIFWYEPGERRIVPRTGSWKRSWSNGWSDRLERTDHPLPDTLLSGGDLASAATVVPVHPELLGVRGGSGRPFRCRAW